MRPSFCVLVRFIVAMNNALFDKIPHALDVMILPLQGGIFKLSYANSVNYCEYEVGQLYQLLKLETSPSVFLY
jgi:hypothetical protein